VIRVSDEVRDAGWPGRVVALETTLVAHGFPAGEGVDVALGAERRVREGGVVPATIGVLDGEIVVGLTHEELTRFDASARKVGPRDLAAACAQRVVGATTVGGTLAVCRTTPLQVLATGGLGGVHRGWREHPDVSADLAELARTQAIVVCSGIKSLLDVTATMELLESLAVPVLGWRTETLPLFYTATGGPPVPASVESAAEVAEIARTHWEELHGGAVVVARPPRESLDDVEPLIEDALRAAREEGVAGQRVTPYVLAFLHRWSEGRTLRANRELVLDNASLAAEIALALTDA
jgi:pseudouridine-5'-phosphate glycosidase